MSALLNKKEAAAYLGLSKLTLEKWQREKRGPTYYKIGKLVKYKTEDLDAFIEASRVENSIIEPATVSIWSTHLKEGDEISIFKPNEE